MRIRLTTRPLALFLAFFFAALLLFLPLRLALGWLGLDANGLSARQVTGSIWDGGLRETHVGGVALGDLHAGLSPFPLVLGRARVGLHARDNMLAGALGVSRHSIGVDDLTASVPTGQVFAPLPIAALNFDAFSVRFQGDACATARGQVRALMAGDIGGINLSQGLRGTARCDSGALMLPMVSQAGSEGLDLRLWNDGRFRADLSAHPDDPALVQKLLAAGFQPYGNTYRLSIEGRF
jgi:general secretion pathway protein N